MRDCDYSKIGPKLWTGETGKALRGDYQAQLVQVYLLTSPHANMLGVFQCPLLYISHETGLPLEGASKGLQRLIQDGFCIVEQGDLVWIKEMARFQVGENLVESDKRVKGIQKQFNAMRDGPIKSGFYDRYRTDFKLTYTSPLQAPPKPEAVTDAVTATTTDTATEQRAEAPQPEKSPRGKRLDATWTLPDDWATWALSERKDWHPETVRLVADRFRDYWIGVAGSKGVKADWLATWRNWVRNETQVAGPMNRGLKPATISEQRAAVMAGLCTPREPLQAISAPIVEDFLDVESSRVT